MPLVDPDRAPLGTTALLAMLHHGLFVLLVVVGYARSVGAGAPVGPLSVTVVALLATYAVGARLARQPRAGLALWWLAGLTAAWLATVLISRENVWAAVSLWLLAGHFLRTRWAAAYTVIVLGLVLAAQARGGQPWTSGMAIGPSVGAIFCLILSVGQHRLVRDGIERQRLVDSLVAAQAETEQLHAELVAAQRESGIQAERARLSRDIHDGLAQTFSSILLTARASTTEPGTPQALLTALRRVEESAQDGLEESRRVVRALAPRDLADTSLTGSLRRTLDALTAQSGIVTSLQVEGELAALPTTVEVALLRVAQGALANVRQHAHATRVVATLTDLGDSIRLDIVDDGCGFDPTTATPPTAQGGFGLRGSRDRLRALGGGLDIESQPGEGTALTAYLPLATPTVGTGGTVGGDPA